jgi:alpha-beta hydrolase superfamily lysophospholipase
MQKIELHTHDNSTVVARFWPAQKARATVQILHGMAEHCERYADFAQFLNTQGFNVLAHNHRGHGERTPLGHYADDAGWEKVLADVVTVQAYAPKNLPILVLGHSMGSFIARAHAASAPKIAALILLGSNQQHPALFYAGRTVARVLSKIQGKRHPSGVMDKLSFGAFNGHFKPNITSFDWLSADLDKVQSYIDDPLCGQLSTLGFWTEFMGGLIQVMQPRSLAAIPSRLPILLLGGDKDPVGRMGKGLPALQSALTKTNHSRVTLKLYPEGRHEMLNEVNADEVWQDIVTWINRCTL